MFKKLFSKKNIESNSVSETNSTPSLSPNTELNTVLNTGPDTGLCQVNVGCGPKKRDGWINVDIQQFKSVDVVMDVTKQWQFTDLHYVYAEHFLEHLDLLAGIQFVKNAADSLQQEGWLQLSTPNVEWVLKTHYKFEQNETHEDSIRNTAAINRAFHGWGHRFLYSPALLIHILASVGYENIRLCQYGESEIDTFKNIEQHGGWSIKEGSPSVIIVEAQKTARPITFPKDLVAELTDKFIRFANAKG